MDDQQIIAQLNFMGVDASCYRVVALLPLVQVAWADAVVQPKERARILAVAEEHGLAEGEGLRLLNSWLDHAPTEAYHRTGQALLVALAHKQRGLGAELPLDTLDAVVELCWDVARAAGGLFGVAFTVDKRESTAILEIADALQLGSAKVQAAMASTMADEGAWDGLAEL